MKTAVAVLLGLLSLIPMIVVGEGAGMGAALAVSTAWFFVCQFLLSRGHRDTFRRDWRTMIALVVPAVILAVIIMLSGNKREVIMSQCPVILLSALAGTFVGAFAASRFARK